MTNSDEVFGIIYKVAFPNGKVYSVNLATIWNVVNEKSWRAL